MPVFYSSLTDFSFQQMTRLTWTISLLAVLAACGGGGGDTAPAAKDTIPANPVVTNPPAPTVDVIAQAATTGDASKVDSARMMQATLARVQKQIADEQTTRQAILKDGNASIDWNPTHDSVYFKPLDSGRSRVLLTSNWLYKGTGAANDRILAVAGIEPQTGARYAAFGGNPLAVRGNAAMDATMKNTLSWLTGRDSLSGLKIVTAHLPSTATYWFQHEVPTRNWLAAQGSNVTINGAAGAAAVDDSCDGARLNACLQSADLLVIGRQENPNSGTSSYDGAETMRALKNAQMRGMPVLYLHHYTDAGDLAQRLLAHFALGINENKTYQEGLKAFNVNALEANQQTKDTLALLQRLEAGNFSTTWSGCASNVGKVSCENDTALQNEFNKPASAIRTSLRALDAQGIALFDQPGYALEKYLILLGDTYRRDVIYPMDKGGNKAKFFRAHFSDATAYVNRRYSAIAKDQGSFAPAIATSTPALSRTVSTTAPATGRREYMTGLYVMPGRTVTLTRTDASNAAVTVGLNMLRDTTRLYNTQGYDRPTQIASPRVILTKDKTVTLTSPFGGPVYLFVGAASGAPAISVQVSGVTTHPTLRNPQDAAEVAAFQAELASTPTNWVGIGTDYLTVHSNVKHMRTTLAAHGGDVQVLADRILTYMIKDTYELAGFNSATGTLGLTDSVKAFCNAAGWDCTGNQHRRDVMQHVISDTVAACGAGCSGNPYDQNWALEPLGWGETHEIGHNLQRGRLDIYGGQSGEVSNNIFPIHKQMAFNRATSPASPIKARENSTASAFNLLKSSLQNGASSTHVYDTMWSNTEYAADNSLRLNFYRQLVEYARHYNGTTLTDGWGLYTLIYLLERNFNNAGSNWAASKANLGFDTYTSYPSSITGNDFMLIAASRIVGRDMRPVWDVWGVTYSPTAAAQVAAYGLTAADKLLFPMKNLNAYGNGVAAPVVLSANAIYPVGY